MKNILLIDVRKRGYFSCLNAWKGWTHFDVMRGQFSSIQRVRVNYYFVILFGESRNTGKFVIIGKLISSSESCCEMQAEPCSYQNYHPSIWF